MDDLISRKAVIDALWHSIEDEGGEFQSYAEAVISDAEDAIKSLPPAQKKGHWIDEGTNYLCSECHRGCWVNSDYCPWCGAYMGGKNDEDD